MDIDLNNIGPWNLCTQDMLIPYSSNKNTGSSEQANRSLKHAVNYKEAAYFIHKMNDRSIIVLNVKIWYDNKMKLLVVFILLELISSVKFKLAVCNLSVLLIVLIACCLVWGIKGTYGDKIL